MALPVKQAAELAQSMAKHGLSGSISMGKGVPADDKDKEEDNEYKGDGIREVVEDCADALIRGDKEKAVSCLLELVDRLKEEDKEQDIME